MKFSHLRKTLLVSILLIILSPLSSLQSVSQATYPLEPPLPEPHLKEMATSRYSMVVSAHPFGTYAGLEMLKQGGNAMDAATAATMVIATIAWNVSLAGGHELTYYDSKNNRTICINAEPNAFKKDVMPYNRERDNTTGRSIRVPGSIAGFYFAQKKYGALPWKKVLEPAIFYAENGFPLHGRGYRRMWDKYQTLTTSPSARKIFAPNGFLPKAGEMFKQPELAETLKKIAEHGADYFYKGPFAKKMVQAIQEIGGKPTLDDFESYQPLELKPLKGMYKNYKIFGPPPPSNGTVAIIEGLNILDNVDLKGLGHYSQSADSLQWVIETLRIMFEDTRKYNGILEFDTALTEILMSKNYAKSQYEILRHKIEKMKLQSKEKNDRVDIIPYSYEPEDDLILGTEHVSTIDKEGNICSITQTIYGTGFSYAGLFVGGIVLNSSGGFRAQPGERMVAAMPPVIVFKGEKPYFATGSTGGLLNTFLTTLNMVAWDMNLKEAQEAVRLSAPDTNSNKVRIEYRLDENIAIELKKRGYQIEWAAPYSMAGAQMAGIDPDTGIRYGAADPRNMGKAEGQK